jgi:hypothetical protein
MKTFSRSVLSTPVMVLLASCVLHAGPIFVSGDGIGETFAHPGAYMGTGLPYSGTPVVIASNTLPGAWATSENGREVDQPRTDRPRRAGTAEYDGELDIPDCVLLRELHGVRHRRAGPCVGR